jgi:hypothetical protein
MGAGFLRLIGAFVYFVFKQFKLPFKDCLNFKYSIEIGFIFIIIVFYLVLCVLYLIDGG